MDRIIALVDMDCFYVQVEQAAEPDTKGKPCAVAQYKTWQGGGLIAVGYEARAFGVKRGMMGNEAKKLCRDLHLFRVPESRGKADLTKYREASVGVMKVLNQFSSCVERASIDEAYIDLTEEVEKRLLTRGSEPVSATELPNTFVVDWEGIEEKDGESDKPAAKGDKADWLNRVFDDEDMNIHDKRLAVGGVIAEEMRAAVYRDTGYRCSAGIAHNKMLAKLACGLHKPNKQTMLPHGSVNPLFQTLPIRKIRHLGGKFGEQLVNDLNVVNVADLTRFTLRELQAKLGDKQGLWIHELCRGIEHEPVTARQLPKSIGCGKNFRGREQLDTKEKVKYWLLNLSKELEERLNKDLEMNKRTAKSFHVNVRYAALPQSISASRSCALVKYDAERFAADAFTLLQKFNVAPSHQAEWSPPITNLTMSATKFQDHDTGGSTSITSFLSSPGSVSCSQMASPSQGIKAALPKRGSIEKFLQMSQSTPSPVKPADIPNVSQSSSTSPRERKGSSIKSFFQNYMKVQKSISDRTQTEKPSVSSGLLFGSNTANVDAAGRFSTSTSTENVSTNEYTGELCNPEEDMTDESNCDPSFYTTNTGSDAEQTSQTEQSTPCTDNIAYSELTSECHLTLSNNVHQEKNKPVTGDIDVHTIMSDNVGGSRVKNTVTSENRNGQDILESEVSHDLSHDQLKSRDIDPEDMVSCDQCGESVSAWDLPEHLDFHLAVQLQNEQNQTNINNRVTSTLQTGKRKSLSTKQSVRKKPKPNSYGNIDSFFKKS